MDEFDIRLALDNVAAYSGVTAAVERRGGSNAWIANLNGKPFAVLYRNSITTQSAAKARTMAMAMKAEYGLCVLVVAAAVSASVMDMLFREGISVAETSGNCRIANGEIFINVSGHKKSTINRQVVQPYTPAKLKVIFYLLLHKENVSRPFRHISEKTGVSLSVIKQTIDDLVNKKFVITTPKGRVMKNRKGLLELWSLHYNQVLKPKLLMAKFDFANAQNAGVWTKLQLPQGFMWGGEPAEALTEGYLKPELFEIYSSEVGIELLSTGVFKPSANGVVAVYRKFWQGYDQSPVPDVLIYADLAGIADSCCQEAAHRLLNKITEW